MRRKIYSDGKSALVNAHRRIQFGWNLSTLRIKQKLTQEKLADLVGLTRTSIINIEQGRQLPPLTSLPEFCKHLKCKYTDLLQDFI